MANGRIESLDEFDRSVTWIIEKAAELEDPLLSPSERARLQQKIDFVDREVMRYYYGRMVQKNPFLREVFLAKGREFYDLDENGRTIGLATAAPADEPEQKSKSKKPTPSAVALADWLDDE